ncbi:M20 family metallopeptidase [Clostridium ganghwense]|uniref:M20 family metallopeptidase n=1 Tax=Clostridium ganghwense TaxID=312089 RepID=A0ABT4CJ56_9CLOT|nr:M20 family metallopeptidase [Clostridium ganghwense]MCY6369082.1 M20 family metallopeptidase [Clostridium ganghwense]
MNIENLANKYKEHVINLRREFHRFPEESWREERTSRRVKEELQKIGVDFEATAKTGIVATLRGKNPGKIVALRADMDAIRVKEATGAEFESENEGIMHACGHDGHMAMLIGAAKILKELQNEWDGTVKFIFQPAEEVGEGAAKVIEEGFLDDVQGAFGIHLWSDLPCGKVSVEEGPRMACADIFKIKIKGKGGHGSLPHQGVDAVVAASAIVMNLQTAVSREINPMEPAVVSVGALKAGTRFNVIASEAILEGTTRCFNEEIRQQFPKILERISKNTAASFKAEAELEYIFATPITINDKKCSSIARGSVEKIAGSDAVVLMDKLTVTEDIGRYFEKIHGVLAFVGVRNEKKDAIYPQHHEKYTIDEDALEIGTALYAQYALDFLNYKGL